MSGGSGVQHTDVRVAHDDMGYEVSVPTTVQRIVSLVPSLTETVASLDPGLLVGATQWCTQPRDLQLSRIGGTKNPDVRQVLELRPTSCWRTRRRTAAPTWTPSGRPGAAVWITRIRDLPSALSSLRRMITLACRRPRRPGWGGRGRLAPSAGSRGRSGLGGGRAHLATAMDGGGQRHFRR